MQRKLPQDKDNNFSFTIVDDKSFDFDESITVENARDIPSPDMSEHSDRINLNLSSKGSTRIDLLDTDTDDNDDDEHLLTESSPKRASPNLTQSPIKGKLSEITTMLSHQSSIKTPSAGPSRRQNSRLKSPIPRERQDISSDSDSDESGSIGINKRNRKSVPGEYDPSQFFDLDTSEDVKELFQYITRYIPQQLSLDFKFKPFVPDFIPAVGDIDAFLKIIPPSTTISGEKFDPNQAQLGLAVLDEPAANQSDPALLHLQLRATSFNVSHANQSMVVKKVDNVEKSSRTIDKWIKDVTDLHRSRTAPIVKYSNSMPDLDDLMQEWPEDIENVLKLQGFPHYKFPASLSQYAEFVCCLFDIPVYQNKIQSLHLLFCLYAAIKSSQLYRSHMAQDKGNTETDSNNKSGGADQLVLE